MNANNTNSKKEIQKHENTTLSQERINQAFGGSELQIPKNARLPAISIMRETAQYEMSDGSLVKSFVGHILHYHFANMFYAKPYGEGDPSPPDCYSSDGIDPDDNVSDKQGEHCFSYRLNRPRKKDDDNSLKCTNYLILYVLVDGEVIPSVVKAPPSSLNSRGSMMRWLTSAPNIASKAGLGVSYQPIRVEFGLEKKTFPTGRSASVITLTTVRPLELGDEMDLATFNYLNKVYRNLKENLSSHAQDAVSQTLSVGAPPKNNEIDDTDVDDTDIENEPDTEPDDDNGDTTKPSATENDLFDNDDNDGNDPDEDVGDAEPDEDVDFQCTGTPNPDYSDNPEPVAEGDPIPF